MKYECTLYQNGLIYKQLIIEKRTESAVKAQLRKFSRLFDWAGKWEFRAL